MRAVSSELKQATNLQNCDKYSVLSSCASTDIIAMTRRYKYSGFLNSSRNLGIKSGRNKFDMVPEWPASMEAFRTFV